MLVGLALLALLVGPFVWAQLELSRHGRARPDLGGTGTDLARHLLDLAELDAVKVEPTTAGDHYDPVLRRVRLSPAHADGRSLAALTIAAHEVGHALQHRDRDPGLALRLRLAPAVLALQRAATVAIIVAPPIGLLLGSPGLARLGFVAALLAGLAGTALSLVTLPVEFDASFNRALPILRAGRFVPEADLPAARRLLTAALLTYVAGTLIAALSTFRGRPVLR